MKQMIKLIALCVAMFGIVGCENTTDASVVTSGTNFTKEQHQAMQNVDYHSYAEVADVFKETGKIQSDGKPYLLVFGANGCVYCDRLKNLIKEESEIKETLRANYAPYYINISYSKTHDVEFLGKEVTTTDLVQKYSIKPTPTLVFLSSSGKELFSYPGFMPKEKFLRALEFFKNPNLEQNAVQAIQQEFQAYLMR